MAWTKVGSRELVYTGAGTYDIPNTADGDPLTLEIHGAEGEAGHGSYDTGAGGQGGYLEVEVDTNSSIEVQLASDASNSNGGSGYQNGGNGGYVDSAEWGGGGGGLSVLKIGGNVVAHIGGGGGGAGADYSNTCSGGGGGASGGTGGASTHTGEPGSDAGGSGTSGGDGGTDSSADADPTVATDGEDGDVEIIDSTNLSVINTRKGGADNQQKVIIKT